MRIQVHGSGFLGKLMALLIGAVLLVFVFMFSLLILVPLGVIGVLVLGYQFRKMKNPQQQMHEQSPDGHAIEGEVIYEVTEAGARKSVRSLKPD
jgi:membrane protein implicated in regulation of membrane protease activity